MSRRSSIWNSALLTLLAAQLVVFEIAVVNHARLPRAPLPRLIIALVGTAVYVLAIFCVAFVNRRRVKLIAVAAAVAITVRFYTPVLFEALLPADTPKEVMAATTQPRLAAFLRELASAQEQYRLRNRVYSAQLSPLLSWMPDSSIKSVAITARGDTGWSASAAIGDARCTIWVRDATLRPRAEDVEGSPACGAEPESRTRLHGIRTVLVHQSIESPFKPADISGRWLQHRGDAQRSAQAEPGLPGAGHSWTSLIGGPIRSSVAIAGNQVFVGAHANGEVVALSLDSGKIGFRLRAPNWIHHEPVVTDNLVIFSFGNNEPSDIDPQFLGSPPSGIVAYDRRTGIEVWRRYTKGSVMVSPVILDSMLVIATGSHEALAYRLRDGAPIWRATMPDFSPMANPLLIDSVFIIGVEPATVCAIGIRSGKRIYCHVLSSGSWGAGHASAAIAGDLVLQVYEEDLDGSGGTVDGPVMVTIRRIFGLPPRRHHARPPNARREQVMVALHWRDGSEAWRVRLGEGTLSATGHTAGTPTVQGGVAFVPSPVSETVSAIDTRTGKMAWTARVNPARGSVLVTGDAVIAATRDTGLVVLDRATGRVRCRQRLPQVADRAGPTVSGSTAVLTLTEGMVIARPIADFVACRV